ncbi:hypothetical protein HOG21_08480 [bacterium]|jgi:hypothetical protein|nr:hypothetical protein [bacterium]
MTYCTIEATLDKNNIVYDNAFVAPKTKTRVLITFLESTDGLIELNENELTDEFTE